MDKENKNYETEKDAEENTKADKARSDIDDSTLSDNQTSFQKSTNEVLPDNAYSLNYFKNDNELYGTQQRIDKKSSCFRTESFPLRDWGKQHLEMISSNEKSYDNDSSPDNESRRILPRPKSPVASLGRRKFATSKEITKSSKRSCDSDSYSDTESREISPTLRPKSPGANKEHRRRAKNIIKKDSGFRRPKTSISNTELPSTSATPPVNYIAQGARPKIRTPASRQSTLSTNSRITPSIGDSNDSRSDIQGCPNYISRYNRPILAAQMTKLEIINKFMSSCQPNDDESFE